MRELARCGVPAVMLLAAVGCGGPEGGAEVTGTVRYQSRALTSGSVTFVGADGKESHSAIGADGRYVVVGVAAGKARVGVVSHPRVPEGLRLPDAKGERPVKAQEVPARYGDPGTSGLTVEVQGRRVERDLDLAP